MNLNIKYIYIGIKPINHSIKIPPILEKAFVLENSEMLLNPFSIKFIDFNLSFYFLKTEF